MDKEVFKDESESVAADVNNVNKPVETAFSIVRFIVTIFFVSLLVFQLGAISLSVYGQQVISMSRFQFALRPYQSHTCSRSSVDYIPCIRLLLQHSSVFAFLFLSFFAHGLH